MRITDLAVDGYGVWSGLELCNLSEGLNVFYGPNEAGKTTLMQFVRSMFFGFSPERRARYLPPVYPGRPGGTIQVLSGDAAYSIARHPDELDGSQLVVSRGTRFALDHEGTLAALLGEVDEPTFNNVFVFGLREIQELATLDDTRAAEELYNLALGLDRVSLLDVLKELNASRERLLAADDRPSLISQLLGQRERLQGEVDELGHASTRYLALAAERQRLGGDIYAIEAEHARWDGQLQALVLARGLTDRWRRRGELADQLAMLDGLNDLPEGGLERLERFDARIALYGRRAHGVKRQRSKLRAEVARLKINEGLTRLAPRFEALAEQQQWIAALEKQVTDLESELLELESDADEGKKQWGGSGVSLSKQSIAELREAAREVRDSRREAQRLHEATSSADEQAAAARKRIDDALGGKTQQGLTDALAAAGQLVADLRKRSHLDERITQLTSRESELEEQSHDHLESQVLPTWALAGLGSLFVIGCALVLLFVAGLILPASLGDSLGWPVGLIGVGAAAAAGLTKFWMERSAEGRTDKCQQQLSLLAQQIEQAKAERDDLDERLPRGGGPLTVRLQAAEKSLSKLEELLPLESQRESTAGGAAHTRAQAEATRDRCRQARKRWLRLLADHRLPSDLSPPQLKAYARGRRQVAGLDGSIADKKSELGRRRVEYESLAARITQLVSQAGVTPRSKRPLEQLQQCLTELAEQQTVLKSRAELAARSTKLRKRYRLATRRRNTLRRGRHALLRAAGTLDPLEFRARASRLSDFARMRSEHAQLEREITAALSANDKHQLEGWLRGSDDLTVLETQAAEARRAAAARLSEAQERRGELNHQLKLLAEDRQLAEKQIELDVVDERLAEALQRWRVLAVCNLLLAAVREFYEREHQPQALREASGYLKRLTGGRYTRIWTPLGESSLRVDDQAGHTLTAEQMSSGTREQLLLALRLALISSHAKRGVELPLVLDDVLVNFDVVRAKAAAAVLRDFAKQGHQVLVFTCHEHIARLFRNLKAEVRRLPDHTQGNFVVEEERPRREREVAVEVEEESAPEPELEPVLVEAEAATATAVAELPPAPEPAPEPAPPVAPPRAVQPAIPAPPQPAPAPPASKPVARKPRRRVIHRTERVRWNAEEFDGELADRVRREIYVEEEPDVSSDADDDSQAA